MVHYHSQLFLQECNQPLILHVIVAQLIVSSEVQFCALTLDECHPSYYRPVVLMILAPQTR